MAYILDIRTARSLNNYCHGQSGLHLGELVSFITNLSPLKSEQDNEK